MRSNRHGFFEYREVRLIWRRLESVGKLSRLDSKVNRMPECGHCGAAVLSSQKTCPMCTRVVNPAGRDLLIVEQRKPKSRTTRNYGASVPDLDRYAYAEEVGVNRPVEAVSATSRIPRYSREASSSNTRSTTGKQSKCAGTISRGGAEVEEARVEIADLKGNRSCFQIIWPPKSGRPLRSREFPPGFLKTRDGMKAVERIHSDFLRVLRASGWQVRNRGKSRFDVSVVKSTPKSTVSGTGNSSSTSHEKVSTFSQYEPQRRMTSNSALPVTRTLQRDPYVQPRLPVSSPPTRAAVRLVPISKIHLRFELIVDNKRIGPCSQAIAQPELLNDEGRKRIEEIRRRFVSSLRSRGWSEVGPGKRPYETIVISYK